MKAHAAGEPSVFGDRHWFKMIARVRSVGCGSPITLVMNRKTASQKGFTTLHVTVCS